MTSYSSVANVGLQDYAAAYRRVKMGGQRQDAAAINTAIVLFESGQSSLGGASSGKGLFYVDPADHAIPGLSTLYRLKLEVATNATAPTSTFTGSLGTVGALAGAAADVHYTANADVTNSSAQVAAPALQTAAFAVSADFALTAGWYYLKLAISVANMVANSSAWTGVYLDVHNV